MSSSFRYYIFIIFPQIVETTDARSTYSQNQGDDPLLHAAEQGDPVDKTTQTTSDSTSNTSEQTVKLTTETVTQNATFLLDSVMHMVEVVTAYNDTLHTKMNGLKATILNMKAVLIESMEEGLAKMNDSVNLNVDYTRREFLLRCHLNSSSEHDFMISVLEDIHFCWGNRIC